jgi:hypothetical protein
MLLKESLISNVHQCHHYLQIEQSPLISSEFTEHKKIPQYMKLKIQVLARDRHKNVAELNWLMFAICC